MNAYWSIAQDLCAYIANYPALSIGLLGPQGTSSDYALDRMINTLNIEKNKLKVLVNNFDNLYKDIHSGDVDLAMVPAAYTLATRFFWSSRLQLMGAVVEKTPDYHFCCKSGNKNMYVIATCSAVSHLLDECFSAIAHQPYEIMTVSSTAEAAKAVLVGQADACITNALWRNKMNFQSLSVVSGVDMVWLFFRKNDENCTRNKL